MSIKVGCIIRLEKERLAEGRASSPMIAVCFFLSNSHFKNGFLLQVRLSV